MGWENSRLETHDEQGSKECKSARRPARPGNLARNRWHCFWFDSLTSDCVSLKNLWQAQLHVSRQKICSLDPRDNREHLSLGKDWTPSSPTRLFSSFSSLEIFKNEVSNGLVTKFLGRLNSEKFSKHPGRFASMLFQNVVSLNLVSRTHIGYNLVCARATRAVLGMNRPPSSNGSCDVHGNEVLFTDVY